MYLDYRSLLTPPGLDFDEDVHQGDRCRGDTGDAGSMSEGTRTHSNQYFLDLAGEAADLDVHLQGRDALMEP